MLCVRVSVADTNGGLALGYLRCARRHTVSMDGSQGAGGGVAQQGLAFLDQRDFLFLFRQALGADHHDGDGARLRHSGGPGCRWLHEADVAGAASDGDGDGEDGFHVFQGFHDGSFRVAGGYACTVAKRAPARHADATSRGFGGMACKKTALKCLRTELAGDRLN